MAPHIYFDLGAANRHGLMEFWIKYKTIKMRHADDDPQRRGRGINIKLVIDQLGDAGIATVNLAVDSVKERKR